ncbi:MAG TPA: flagellar filament capping protein FliD, partial [Sedimentisphaerales bacterium]|nr:flagellar filament capping protein FliD [Sedimentisphaerales bacterium]
CQIKVDGYPPEDSDWQEGDTMTNWMTRSSNTIDDAIYGVTLNLHDTTDKKGEQVSLTRNIESLSSKMIKLVEAYNSTVTFIKENTAYDASTEVAGVLMGDYIVSIIKNQILSPIMNHASGFVSDKDSFLNPTELGLEIDSDGVLSLDSTLFSEAITEDYLGVLELIGADKSGSGNSDIKFYSASSSYTDAGNYNVKVKYDASGNLSEAWIKLTSEDESKYRQATIKDGVIIGNSEFSSSGEPLYGENALQLTAPITGTANSQLTGVINIKHGFAGVMEDALDMMLKYNGTIDISQNHIDEQIELLKDKIDQEETRLTKREERLTAKFARLESILSTLQAQLAQVSST